MFKGLTFVEKDDESRPQHRQSRLKVETLETKSPKPNPKMDSLYKEAVACVEGEEKVQVLLESIRSQTTDSGWLEFATTLAQQATIDYQTRAVEVDRWIETMDTSTQHPFTSLSLATLNALNANLAILAVDGSFFINWSRFKTACSNGCLLYTSPSPRDS